MKIRHMADAESKREGKILKTGFFMRQIYRKNAYQSGDYFLSKMVMDPLKVSLLLKPSQWST
jgi:hypothetical protein